MVFAHVISDLLLQNTPWNVALVDILVDNRVTVCLCLLLSLLDDTLISIKAVKVDKLLLNQVALALIIAVAPSAHDRHF